MLLPSYSVLPRRLPFSGDRMRDIITCVLGTLGFCVILNVSKRMIMPATLGGAISAVLFYVFGEMGYGDFISTLFATVAISVYSLATAKLKKAPASTVLLPASIPLLPGGSLYYMMSSLVHSRKTELVFYAKETVLVGMGIALGAVIVSIPVKIIKALRCGRAD